MVHEVVLHLDEDKPTTYYAKVFPETSLEVGFSQWSTSVDTLLALLPIPFELPCGSLSQLDPALS